MSPTLFQCRPTPPILPGASGGEEPMGEFFAENVYRGIEHQVPRDAVRYLRVCQEVRADLEQLPNGSYRSDHPSFEDWYATPVHKVSGPFGWPSYVAKASLGIVPVEADGSVRFLAPAGKVLYFQVLDDQLNELQRMRSVVQLQPGETRSCVGCHEPRSSAPPARRPLALARPPRELQPPPWGPEPFDYSKVVQPVWDTHCVQCHDGRPDQHINLSSTLDAEKIPLSYRELITQGWVHYLDFGYNSGGNEKRDAMTFGSLKSKLWLLLDAGHYDVKLSLEDRHRIKCWIDLNCPLWPDYQYRPERPIAAAR